MRRRELLATLGAVGASGCLRLIENEDTPTPKVVVKTPTQAGTGRITGSQTRTGSSEGSEDGPIPVGSILPLSGGLSGFGPDMEAAVRLAVDDINQDGGPLGRELGFHPRDSGTDVQTARSEYTGLVSEQDIVGFVGAASSGVSGSLAREVVADQVMQISPASTSPTLAQLGYNADGSVKYFGRTGPNDGQQGTVMGMILNEYVAAGSAAFLHVNNAYGEGVAREAQEAFDGETLRLVPYDPDTTDYTSTLDELFQGDPDGIGFMGYPPSGQSILETWANGGYGGEWVLSEGLNSPDLFESIPDITEGMYVSSPDPEQTGGADRFRDALGHEPGLFSPHAYDAMFLMAMAIHRAGEASGTAIANNIRSVAGGDGNVVTVREFGEATDTLDGGGSVNYQGASSPVELNEHLEPIYRFAILQVQAAETVTIRHVSRSEFD